MRFQVVVKVRTVNLPIRTMLAQSLSAEKPVKTPRVIKKIK